MPELPETETIARDLDREIRGRTIVGVAVTRPDVLREDDAEAFAARLVGAGLRPAGPPPGLARVASWAPGCAARGAARSSWCSTSPPATGSWCSRDSRARSC